MTMFKKTLKNTLLAGMVALAGTTAFAHSTLAKPATCYCQTNVSTPKFALINPNSNGKATLSMAGIAQNTAGEKATIVGHTNLFAPSLLTTPEDMVVATQGVVDIGKAVAGTPDVKGIIVSAFSDPGLKELRAMLPHFPIVGIGEEAFHEAAASGQPFAIVTITPDPALLASFQDKADELGYTAQYRGVVVTPGDPNEILKDEKRLDEALTNAVNEAMTKGAKAIIMGGGPLSAPATRIQPNVQVPLVIAVEAATRKLLSQHESTQMSTTKTYQ